MQFQGAFKSIQFAGDIHIKHVHNKTASASGGLRPQAPYPGSAPGPTESDVSTSFAQKWPYVGAIKMASIYKRNVENNAQRNKM